MHTHVTVRILKKRNESHVKIQYTGERERETHYIIKIFVY